MIDHRARKRLGERLRHLVTGQMTNDAFEDAAVRTRDMAVREIEWRLAWPHYDDMHEHTLKDEFTLTDGIRRDFARAILFLHTDLEYEWKHRMGLRGFLNSSFHLWPLRRTPPIRTEGGDLRYWPFYRRSDYTAARKAPTYLGGRKGQLGASPSGVPGAPVGNSRASDGPPSVSVKQQT
jgi:hypothetical protein